MIKNYSINIVPVAQGRPRFTVQGGYAKVYDPPKSAAFKKALAWELKCQNPTVLKGALTVTIIFRMPRPKSLPKKVVHHIKKPDVDNLVKGVKDAMNKLCYNDDSQIVELRAKKIYSTIPGVDITLEQMGG